MKIVKKQISEIKPYWRNARDNSQTIAKLKKSIKHYGFNQPIVIDPTGVIIVGHARYKAITELGFQEVDCVIADLTKEQAKEYRIADNKVAESTNWNYNELITELREIGNVEDMQDYFDNIDLGDWLGESVGQNISAVTDTQVEENQERLSERFSNSGHDEDISVVMMCPHCASEFKVSRSYFIK